MTTVLSMSAHVHAYASEGKDENEGSAGMTTRAGGSEGDNK